MSSISAEERALDVLAAAGSTPATRSASGRYQRSLPIAPGVRYWATSQPRLRQDFLGVQFYGEGAVDVAPFAERLRRNGFGARTPQTGQLTFAKSAAFAPAGGIDVEAIRRIRRDIDTILRDRIADEDARVTERPISFRQFMLASPLAQVELVLPNRGADWRTGEF